MEQTIYIWFIYHCGFKEIISNAYTLVKCLSNKADNSHILKSIKSIDKVGKKCGRFPEMSFLPTMSIILLTTKK